VYVAVPEEFSGTAVQGPICQRNSGPGLGTLKLTVPVGVATPVWLRTIAVNVIGTPGSCGFAFDVTVVVVEGRLSSSLALNEIREDDSPAIRRPAGKDILRAIMGDLRKSGSIDVDDVEFDGPGHIMTKHNARAIRRIVGEPCQIFGAVQQEEAHHPEGQGSGGGSGDSPLI